MPAWRAAPQRHSTDARTKKQCGQSALRAKISSQRRGSVQRPVSPGRTSEAILEEHAYDGNHRQSAVVQLSQQTLLFLDWVLDAFAEWQAEGPVSSEVSNVLLLARLDRLLHLRQVREL